MNPFHATGLFLNPLKNQKASSFLTFSGDVERDQWHEMRKKKNQKPPKAATSTSPLVTIQKI